jgi:hypothetical protein
MSINIVDVIQKRTPYPELHKIDPNLQEIHEKDAQTPASLMGQAAIPAVLTAVYKHSRNDEDANRILNSDPSSGMLGYLFNDSDRQVVENVARYAGISPEKARDEMEHIAGQSISVIKEFLGRETTPQRLKTFMNDQRHNILVYLPAQLHLGDFLADEALDDRTNKMEGPVSNFMHKIEDKFSQGGG